MHRSSGGLTAIWLVGWAAIAPGAFAQQADPAKLLPAIEIDAPLQHQDARPRPKHGANRGRQSNHVAIPNSPPAVTAVPAANAVGTSRAPMMVTSSSERNVSGEDIKARPFSRPAEA